MLRTLLNALLYLPSREFVQTPERVGLSYRDAEIATDDGERLHGWWIRPPGDALAPRGDALAPRGDALAPRGDALAPRGDALGHILLCHGNAGNVGDRLLHAALLTAAGFDVLLFDYRGYGHSTGRPSERGTYRDAQAAHCWLVAQPGVDPARVVYLGESLGGAVALDLALARPPAGLVLLSAFTGVRQLARRHYPFLPARLVPDVYPSVTRVSELRSPLLVLHGDRDEIVPLAHGQALFAAAPEPKHMHVFADVGHNDLVPSASSQFAEVIASWIRG